MFDEAYMQRALLELVLLAISGGVLGSWIVLRRLAFFSHAVGTSTFPGLVLAEAWGVPAQPMALLTGAGFAGGLRRVDGDRRVGADAATALLLVTALALGVVLASDVYETGGGVDRLLFGSLLGLSDADLLLTGLMAVIAVGADAALRRRWTVAGFDPTSAAAPGARAADRLLLVLIAAAVVVSLAAVGALLVSAALVLPAATARLLTRRLRALQIAAVAIGAGEGVAALLLARLLDVGPGSALAVVGSVVFAIVAVARR